MRHPPATLLDPLRFPGSLGPGLRSAFADAVQEPVPERLAALVRKLEAEADDGGREAEADDGGREDADHGPSTAAKGATAKTDSIDRS
jgi:hypothetical protein